MYLLLKKIIFSLITFILKRSRNYNVKNGKTAVFTFARIGDTVFQIPAIKLILEKHKDVIFIVNENSKIILETYFNKNINNLIVSKKDFIKDRIPSRSLLKSIKELNIEIFIDLSGNIISAIIASKSGARTIIGFNEPEFSSLYTHYVPKRIKPHLTDLYLDPLLKYYGNIKIEKIFKTNYKSDDPILIHPFAGWKAKEWDIKNFINIASELNKKHPTFIIAEEQLIDRELNSLQNIIKTSSLKDLIENIKKCSLFISNDSGPLYIAAMMGKPTYTLYGPTNPEYSKPFGSHHKIITKKVECSPLEGHQYCFTDAGRRGCNKFICMEELSLDELISDIYSFIDYLEIK